MLREGMSSKEDKGVPEEIEPFAGLPAQLKAFWDAHSTNPEAQHTYHEVELTMDTRITGEFDLGPVQYYLCDFGNPSPGHPLTHCVALQCYDVRENDSYQPHEAAKELAGLLTLFLRRRVWAGKVTRNGNRPAQDFSGLKSPVDGDLLRPLGKSISVSENGLRMALSLPLKDYVPITTAVGLYHAAVMVIEDDPQTAYINLVSAIESLAGHEASETEPTEDSVSPDLATLLDKYVQSADGKEAFVRWAWRKELAKRRFVGFIRDTVPPCFWLGSEPEGVVEVVNTVRQRELSAVLKTIYGRRSDLLHGGTPFPAHAIDGSVEWARYGVYDGSGHYPEGKAVPAVRWFERLVNACIGNYIRQLSRSRRTASDDKPGQ